MIYKEYFIEKGLLVISLISIIVVALMLFFIMSEAMPFFFEYGVLNFIFGCEWMPDLNKFGIFPMILSSLIITSIALIIAIPLSIFCSIFLEEIASANIKLMFKPLIQALAGIPSVVYGFFGLTFLVPIIRQYFGGSGFSIIAASLILAIMILPTIISVSQDAIHSVPQNLREASLALGSTRYQSIKHIVLPQAILGISTAIILGLSRAIGETLAVLIIVGNVPLMPNSIFDPARTLTSNIALEMSYATGMHYNSLFATAIILFAVILSLMLILNSIKLRRCFI